jgi:hypothetical protein
MAMKSREISVSQREGSISALRRGFALTRRKVVLYSSPMNEPESQENPQPPFRWNPKVIQMAGLVMVALALPLTIAIYGIRDIRKASETPDDSAGLRTVLENIVDEKWQAPVLEGAFRPVAREVPDGEACAKAGEALQSFVRDSGGSVLTPEKIESGGTRWLVQIPADRAEIFEAKLGSAGYTAPAGECSGDPVIYSIETRIAP